MRVYDEHQAAVIIGKPYSSLKSTRLRAGIVPRYHFMKCSGGGREVPVYTELALAQWLQRPSVDPSWPRLLTSDEAAAKMGCSRDTLGSLHSRGRGPKYLQAKPDSKIPGIKAHTRFYRPRDVAVFCESWPPEPKPRKLIKEPSAWQHKPMQAWLKSLHEAQTA